MSNTDKRLLSVTHICDRSRGVSSHLEQNCTGKHKVFPIPLGEKTTSFVESFFTELIILSFLVFILFPLSYSKEVKRVNKLRIHQPWNFNIILIIKLIKSSERIQQKCRPVFFFQRSFSKR